MSSELTSSDLAEIRHLCEIAFDGDFDDNDFDHALGGTHALAYVDERLVGHASVVPRSMVLGRSDARCGYVEAVATAPDHRRQGIGSSLMEVVEEAIVDDARFGALAASEAGRPLYIGRGWSQWRGQLYAFTPEGRVRTPSDEGSVLVFGEGLDLDAELTCDQRSGDLW